MWHIFVAHAQIDGQLATKGLCGALEVDPLVGVVMDCVDTLDPDDVLGLVGGVPGFTGNMYVLPSALVKCEVFMVSDA